MHGQDFKRVLGSRFRSMVVRVCCRGMAAHSFLWRHLVGRLDEFGLDRAVKMGWTNAQVANAL